jgi:hypothetical protein
VHTHADDQLVSQAVMMTLTMVVGNILRHRPSEVPFPERNDPIEAFFLDRP